MTAETALGPLLFERIALAKPWGGRALAGLRGVAAAGPIGETWEVSDRADHNSVAAVGPQRGQRLDELMRARGPEILGRSRPAAGGRFPLLIKHLDAAEPLSVQVHPHERTRTPGEDKKTECWYVLRADEGARVWLGLAAGVTREALADRAPRRELLELLRSWPVRAGDFVFVPAGTVHAVGGGITLVEIQENADLTHRFYDWDRVDAHGRARALQVEDALRATVYDAPPPRGPFRALEGDASGTRELCRCAEFSVEIVAARAPLELAPRAHALVAIAVDGAGQLPDSNAEIRSGDAWLVPAAVETLRVEPRGTLTLLLARAS